MIRYQFLHTFSYPFYLFEIYDNFSFSKLNYKKMSLFEVFDDLLFAGNTRHPVDQYKQLVEDKICYNVMLLGIISVPEERGPKTITKRH